MIGKLSLLFGVLAVGLSCMAQAPAGAPAGATALCNDGTYYTGATKSGACSGHKGLKTWYGKATAPPGTASTKPSTPPPAPAAAPPPPPAASGTSKTPTTSSKTPLSSQAPAPGGGPGLVWLNTASNVYHCPGSQYYGKTKAGAYMSEADAKAKGAHPNGGKPCK